MKTLLIAILMTSGLAQAQISIDEPEVQTVTIERARAVHNLTLNLNKQTVRCLIGDYSASSLKISVPELVGLTRFKQTTRGETAPCINAGACRSFNREIPDLNPDMILDANRPQENVAIQVVLNEIITVYPAQKICRSELREIVDADVRGLHFHHVDGDWGKEADYETCLKVIADQTR